MIIIMTKLLSLTTAQLAFIIIIPLILVLIGILILIFFYLKKKKKDKFKESYYKKINDIVMYNDYLLLNQFPITLEEGNKTLIDHIVCGNKFIYLISDFYFGGDLIGKATDSSLILINNEESKSYVDNPLQLSKKLLTRFAIVYGFDPSLLIGVSLINDECSYDVKNPSEQFFIVKRNDLSKFISSFEKRDDVGNIKEEQIVLAIKTLAKLKKGKPHA